MKMKINRHLIISFGAALCLGALALSAQAKDKRHSVVTMPKKSVVVFPVDVPSGVKGPQDVDSSMEVTNALVSKLAQVQTLTVSRFSKRNPSVLRAVSETQLTPSQIAGPYNEDDGATRRSVALGRVLGDDIAVSGSLAAYNYDTTSRTATVTLLIEFLNPTDGKVIASTGGATKYTGSPNDSETVTFIKATSDAAATVVAQAKTSLGMARTADEIKMANPTQPASPSAPAANPDKGTITTPSSDSEPVTPTKPSSDPTPPAGKIKTPKPKPKNK